MNIYDHVHFVTQQIVNTEVIDTLIRWGMPETMRHVHPIYFSKCLAKVSIAQLILLHAYVFFEAKNSG